MIVASEAVGGRTGEGPVRLNEPRLMQPGPTYLPGRQGGPCLGRRSRRDGSVLLGASRASYRVFFRALPVWSLVEGQVRGGTGGGQRLKRLCVGI